MRHYGVAVLGAGGVGKSSIVLRVTKDAWDDVYDPTIEDMFTHTFEHASGQLKLDIVDTAGYDQFNNNSNEHLLLSSDGYIIVFSLDSRESLTLAGMLIITIKKLRPERDLPMIVVCNKMDLASGSEVQQSHVQRFSEEYGVRVITTSARLNRGIREAFNMLNDKLVAHLPNGTPKLRKKKSSWWKRVF